MLKPGDDVIVSDCGGTEVGRGPVEEVGVERTPDFDGRMYLVNGRWWPEQHVCCAACALGWAPGSDPVCRQCGAEADLSGMLYA